MSPELIGILSMGVALGGLVIGLGGLMLTLQSRTDKRLDGFESALHALGERVARLGGLIEGSGLFGPARPTGTSEAAGD